MGGVAKEYLFQFLIVELTKNSKMQSIMPNRSLV